jgi:hypothetical protein
MKGLDKGGQGPTSGCCAIEEKEEESFRMEVWMYRSTFSWPRHYVVMSGQLQALAALPQGNESPVPIG